MASHGLSISFPELGLGGRDGTEAEDPIPVAISRCPVLQARPSKPTAIAFIYQNSSSTSSPLSCSQSHRIAMPWVLHSPWTRRRQGRAGWEGRRAEIPHHLFWDDAGFAAGPVKLGWHPLQGSTGPEEAGQRCSKVCPDFVRGWKPHSSSFRVWLWKCPSFC